MRHLVCVGLGYSAGWLARLLLGQGGWRITGTSTEPASVARIAAEGHAGVWFDGRARSAELAAALADATHLLVSAQPGADGDPMLACHAGDIARASALEWIGYLSTVGVYGDHGGGWVDESAPARPGQTRSVIRLAAENAWLDLGRRSGRPVMIFRLAGIYGPGRSAFDKIRSGRERTIVKQGQVFNRIHAADIARVLAASMARPNPGAVYNVADDEPAPAEEVMAFAAGLLGVPPPTAAPIESARLTPMAASFYAENKRVRNERIKSELGVRLQFPSYRQGLADILKSQG